MANTIIKILSWLGSFAFLIQSLVVSSAMITRELTVPFVADGVTVAAGWITLVLVVLAILVLFIQALMPRRAPRIS